MKKNCRRLQPLPQWVWLWSGDTLGLATRQKVLLLISSRISINQDLDPPQCMQHPTIWKLLPEKQAGRGGGSAGGPGACKN